MKNLILITFLFITVGANAQTTKPIDGFLGIKFGSTKTQVTKALNAKGGVLDKSHSDTNSLAFSNIVLGGRQATALFADFINDQVYESQLVFRPQLESQTITYYNDLIKDITGVYGLGKASKTFKQPYQDGDGYEITALKSGNADYQTYWHVDDNYITVTIEVDDNQKLLVRLTYDDGKLFNLHKEQIKNKNKSEF